MNIKKYLIVFFMIAGMFSAFGQFSISKTSYISGQEIDAPGLDTIFIVEDLGSGLTLKYSSADSTFFQWASFDISNGSMDFNVMVGDMKQTDNTALEITNEGGYALLSGAITQDTMFIWIVDYEAHKPVIDSLMVYDDYRHNMDSCETIMLQLYTRKDEIQIGDPWLKRMVSLTRYPYIEWSSEPSTTISSHEPIIEYHPVPYDDTRYKAVYKETFLSDFTEKKYIGDVEADTLYETVAVNYDDIEGKVIIREDADNEGEQDIGSTKEIKGSAPLNVDFSINGKTSKVEYYDWYVWQHTDGTPSYIRYDTETIRHEFVDPASNSDTQADYYVRLEVSNDYCQVQKDSIPVTIVTSGLDAANIFVIGFGSGLTEFKAVYKSIETGTFRGDIYNRWGRKVFTWTDPSRGWDGRINGRYASPGVYYYIITAKGTDGENLRVKRDLTVLREKGLK